MPINATKTHEKNNMSEIIPPFGDHARTSKARDTFAAESEVKTRTVMLHGFIVLPGGEHEHTDFDDPECKNWNVWVRRDFDKLNEHGEPFDSEDEYDKDFTDLTEAHAYALELFNKLSADALDEY